MQLPLTTETTIVFSLQRFFDVKLIVFTATGTTRSVKYRTICRIRSEWPKYRFVNVSVISYRTFVSVHYRTFHLACDPRPVTGLVPAASFIVVPSWLPSVIVRCSTCSERRFLIVFERRINVCPLNILRNDA